MKHIIRLTALAALSCSLIAGTKAIASKIALVKNGTDTNVQLKHAGMTCWLLPGELMQCPLADAPVSLLSREYAVNVPQKESMGLPTFNTFTHTFSIADARSPVGIVILKADLEVSIVNGTLADEVHTDYVQFSQAGAGTHSCIGGTQAVPAA